MVFFAQEPKVDMRRLLVECMGAFFITLATVGFANNPLGVGLMFMAMVYLAGWGATGYFNPAFTLTLCLAKLMNWVTGAAYMGAQIIGSLIASVGLIFAFGEPFCPTISPEIRPVAAAAIETLLSFVLCAVVLAVVKRNNKEHGWLVLGLTFVAVASFGGVFNPAIAVSSIVTSVLHGGGVCQMKDLIVYLGAPLIGSVLALVFQVVTEKE
ncbi:aquaporin [Methylicorpusculum sp.]|uniref:aquaporin n=1 Tax=Methylicorpusculum sp. TaxID=2713644 RepID=UPI002AB98DBA|nr:aquaporin [Methylicorpusculum sp.]MDZ4150302.1 aquaporin [Methylicorpusculum sp.]